MIVYITSGRGSPPIKVVEQDEGWPRQDFNLAQITGYNHQRDKKIARLLVVTLQHCLFGENKRRIVKDGEHNKRFSGAGVKKGLRSAIKKGQRRQS